MSIETLALVFLFAFLGALLWDMRRRSRAAEARAHQRTRDIARVLGTDRR